jgi:hypothetical protein
VVLNAYLKFKEGESKLYSIGSKQIFNYYFVKKNINYLQLNDENFKRKIVKNTNNLIYIRLFKTNHNLILCVIIKKLIQIIKKIYRYKIFY